MFNQKVNHYTSQNPDYINYSLSAPGIKSVDIHRCGTNVQKYQKGNCSNLPLQSWCSPNVAVESFAMRPIVNPKEYFENIKEYLSKVIYSDSIKLKQSGMVNENYTQVTDYGYEPQSSFLQAINLNVTDRLMLIMGEAGCNVSIYKKLNPLSESLVINDIELTTYQSDQNKLHFYHKVLFSAVNTTRYNTISFTSGIFQDTTGMMDEWDTNIKKVIDSQDLKKKISTGSLMLVGNIALLNNTSCVTGQENECEYTGFNFNDKFEQFGSSKGVVWLKPNALETGTYNNSGEYTIGGYSLQDSGPSNLDQLIEQLKLT